MSLGRCSPLTAAGPPGNGRLARMYLAIIKIVEVLARAGFTVGLTFALPLAAAGRFGFVATLIGLFAFAFNWERHIDIQRRLVGASPAALDAAVAAMMRLWLVNYGCMIPLFGLILYFWADISLWMLLLALVVAMCDQIANSVYNLAVVETRYRLMVALVATKSLALLVTAGVLIFVMPGYLSLELIMLLWTLMSVAATLPIGILWIRFRAESYEEAAPAPSVWDQYRSSLTHFLTGLLAVLILQVDRLMVGGLLLPEAAGMFFRHVMLVGFAYQLFSIASYNRRLSQILALTRNNGVGAAERVVVREMARLVVLVALGFTTYLWLDTLTDGAYTNSFSILPALLMTMLGTALLRMAADFQALILNARFHERRVLMNQLLGFGLTVALLALLTARYGLFGAAWASFAGGATYLFLNLVAVHGKSRMTMTDDR